MLCFIKQKRQDEIESTQKMPDLESFLAQKPLFYSEIDYTRMPRAWQSVKSSFNLPKIIHLVGTNGKGSTGRFLAHYLQQAGFRVGHYSSPHILKFNERIWLDGMDVSDRLLEVHHEKVYGLLSQEFREKLSFFEYTTLLAISIFEGCDYVVLEAGLGGEYDATAVFDNLLTLLTPVAKDHCDFLGDSIEEIVTTKVKATKKALILANQSDLRVYEIAKNVLAEKEIVPLKSASFFSKEEAIMIASFLKSNHFPTFLETNLTLALSAVKYLGLDVDMAHLEGIRLFGRFEKISENIILDVGHNPLAAQALLKALQGREVHLIFNSFADKEYQETLAILKPAIKIIEIIPILNERIEKKENLVKVIEELGIPYKDFTKIEDTPLYLVFGSFSVAEAFLKFYEKTKESKIPH